MIHIPVAELIPSVLNGSSRFVPRVYLPMHDMCLCKSIADKIVHMSGEAAEAGFTAKKPMDVDQEQGSLPVRFLCRD